MRKQFLNINIIKIKVYLRNIAAKCSLKFGIWSSINVLITSFFHVESKRFFTISKLVGRTTDIEMTWKCPLKEGSLLMATALETCPCSTKLNDYFVDQIQTFSDVTDFIATNS